MTYLGPASALKLLLLAPVAAAIVACGDTPPDQRVESSAAILGGDVTNAYPAIGG